MAITDALGAQAFSGLTDATGKIATPLVEYRRHRDAGGFPVKDNHTPHTVSVSKAGCSPAPDIFTVNMVDVPQVLTRSLSCS